MHLEIDLLIFWSLEDFLIDVLIQSHLKQPQ